MKTWNDPLNIHMHQLCKDCESKFGITYIGQSTVDELPFRAKEGYARLKEEEKFLIFMCANCEVILDTCKGPPSLMCLF